MQVFVITPNRPWCGGVVLIAARDSEEAIKVFCKKDYNEDIYDDNSCECNIKVGLDYDTDKPQIIGNYLYLD